MMGLERTAGWNAGVYDHLMNSFAYNGYAMRTALIDGQIEFVANTDEWKEGLLYVRGLIEDGLIDTQSLTQGEEEMSRVAGDPEEILVGVTTSATFWTGLAQDQVDPLKRVRQYVGLSLLEGPNGVRNTLTTPSGLAPGKFVITDRAEDPELIFRWADGLLSEEATFVSSWGEYGDGWLAPDEDAFDINGVQSLYKLPIRTPEEQEQTRTDWMPNVALAARTNDFRLGQQVSDDEEEATRNNEVRLYHETNDRFEPYTSDQQVPSLMYLPEEAEELSLIQNSVETYMNEMTDNFLAGNRDIEADLDAYVAEYEVMGLPRMLEIMQTAYDRQYGGAE